MTSSDSFQTWRGSKRGLASSCITAALLLVPTMASAAPGLDVSGLMGMPTEEGDAAPFTVVLSSAPSSDVSVLATSSLPDSAIVVPSHVTFTPGNWLVPQTFYVIGLDDEIEDGDAAVQLEVTVGAGSDPDYAALPPVLRATEVLDDETTLVIESAPTRCTGPSSEDIYDGSMVITSYDRNHPDAQGLGFDPANPEQDDLVVQEHSDGTFVAMRTLHVVLRNVLEDQMTDPEVEGLMQMYAAAAHHIHVSSGGILMLDYDQVVLDDDWFGYDAFEPPGDPKTEGSFIAYHDLRWQLLLEGYDVDDFDIVNITVGVAHAELVPGSTIWAYAKPSEGGPTFTNASSWDNDRTWTTVQYAGNTKDPGLRDVFLHEMNHTLDFMLAFGIHPEHRNADDAWWLATYPGYVLGSDQIEDLEILTMFWARPKFFYDYLPPTWGELRARTPMHVEETSCPDESTLQMRRAYCEYGVSCDSVCYIGMPCSSGCYCNLEPREGGGSGEGGGGGGRDR